MPVCHPLGTALEVGAEEVANAFRVLQTLDVDRKGGQHLQYGIEKSPPAKTSFAWCDVLEVGGQFELLEFVDQC